MTITLLHAFSNEVGDSTYFLLNYSITINITTKVSTVSIISIYIISIILISEKQADKATSMKFVITFPGLSLIPSKYLLTLYTPSCFSSVTHFSLRFGSRFCFFLATGGAVAASPPGGTSPAPAGPTGNNNDNQLISMFLKFR